MNRHQARENVFYLVFETEFQKDVENPAELYEMAKELGVVEQDEYVERVFFGVMNELSTIDQKISENSKGWKIERLSKVTIAIMRICVYEMLYCDDIPYNVSINEAVELAKKFDHDKSPSFVNGVVNMVAENEGLKK
ncbi:MAG: transcription antitermination factor NusB [Clostridia bacterium]|nr:transcription antitermination factor NusB [Clostridia bacterium]